MLAMLTSDLTDACHVGNVLKIDRHKYVKLAYHGFESLSRSDRLATYTDSAVRCCPLYKNSAHTSTTQLLAAVNRKCLCPNDRLVLTLVFMLLTDCK